MISLRPARAVSLCGRSSPISSQPLVLRIEMAAFSVEKLLRIGHPKMISNSQYTTCFHNSLASQRDFQGNF